MDATDISSQENSPTAAPDIASETSRGSSVSSDLQREYEDILKYAIVTPRFEKELPDIYHNAEARSKMMLSTIAEDSISDRSFSKNGTNSEGEADFAEEALNSDMQALPTNMFTAVVEDQLQTQLYSRNVKNDGELPPINGSSPSSMIYGRYDDKIDDDLLRMENLMDEWCLQLKQNVLGEFSNSKLKQLELMKQNLEMQKKRHVMEEDALRNQIENKNELLHTFEKSVHQKDIVITNLTNALEKQRDKQEKLKILLTWKLKHNDEKREKFASKLAWNHYKRILLSKAWLGWRNVIELRWKQRVERACQARSQEICIKLTEDYEERLQALQKSLEMARLEIASLHSERDRYEETMKKAFMRGVCALNMEAMSMFKEKTSDDSIELKETALHNKDTPKPTTLRNSMSMSARTYNTVDAKHLANRNERNLHVKAVGRTLSSNKQRRNEQLGKDALQPMITSVYVEKHNEEMLQPSREKRRQISCDKSKDGSKMTGKVSRQSIKVVD